MKGLRGEKEIVKGEMDTNYNIRHGQEHFGFEFSMKASVTL